MDGRPTSETVSKRGWLVAALLVAAMMLGGGGSPNPATEIALQLLAVLAALVWLWLPGAGRRLPASLLWLCALVLAVPLLQLVPLPPAIWQALPGRERMAEMLALVGEENSWRPLTISPPRTLASLLSLFPPLLVMVGTALLGRRERGMLLIAIAGTGAAAAMLGGLQLAGGEGAFQLYDRSHPGWLTGFHANRNAAADMLLVASLALSAAMALRICERGIRRENLAVFLIVQAVFLFALLMTGSRAGIALSVLAFGGGLAMFRSAGMRVPKRIIALGAAGAALVLALPLSGRIASVSSRFADFDDPRPDLWQDTLTAIGVNWPAGSGLGTFVPAFLPHERFEVLDASMPNRAHNDFLEFTLETGAFGPILLLVLALILGRMALSGWRSGTRARIEVILAVSILLVMMLHSIVDYPLRNMAGACLAGVAAGLLAANLRKRRARTGAMPE